MWRAVVVCASVLASCDQGERVLARDVTPPRGPIVDADACATVTQADAAALFGKPAIQQPAAPGECVWSCDCDFTDASRIVLRAYFQGSSVLRPFFQSNIISIVYMGESIINGRPHGTPSLWARIDAPNNRDLELELKSDGPSAPPLDSKTDDLRRLGEALRLRMGR